MRLFKRKSIAELKAERTMLGEKLKGKKIGEREAIKRDIKRIKKTMGRQGVMFKVGKTTMAVGKGIVKSVEQAGKHIEIAEPSAKKKKFKPLW